jgi:hypothetical protein
MAKTGENFLLAGGTGTYLSGSTVTTAPYVFGLNPLSALDAVNAAPPSGSGVASGFANNSATPLDRVIVDLALTATPGVGANLLVFGQFIGNFAKNGVLYVTFTGTTGVTIDLTSLASAVGVTSSQYGDTSLATANCLIFRNLSASGTITIAPGGSNPSTLPKFTGTTPTLSTDFGGTVIVYDPSGQTIDSTHKTILLTPSAGGAMAICYGGA